MENTPGDERTKNDSIISTGSQDGGPSFYKTTHIFSGNNFGVKTLIEYDIDEYLDIKEETVHDEEVHQWGKDNLFSRKNQMDEKCIATKISSDNNSGAKTLIEYDIDESLDIKEEIIQDQQTKSESNESTKIQYGRPYSCTTTQISASNNSGGKTLIEYDIDESLDIKEEIVQDQEIHQRGKHNLLSGKNQLDGKCITTEIAFKNKTDAKTLIEYEYDKTLKIKEQIVQDREVHQRGSRGKCITTEMFSDNTSGSKTLIEYEYDETLEIKEESVQDQENIEKRLNEKYELKLCTLDTNDRDTMTIRKPRTSKKKKNLQESKSEPKKTYSCDKCARNYDKIQSLYTHKKFDCDVMPQFICEFCGRRFKRKNHMNRHILRAHQKTNSKTSQERHNCDKCSRSYSVLSSLYKHKRAEHAAVKVQFICDICDFKTKRKYYLSKHITARHYQKIQVSIKKRKKVSILEKKYKCEKCTRSYVHKSSLCTHKKFECDGVPQFGCNFCGKKYKQKTDMNRHILHVHQNADSNTSLVRHNCDRCSRSYIWLRDLIQHKRAEHAVISPQFICDICGFKTKRKPYLSGHITSCHFQEIEVSIQQPGQKYKCDKCARSYSRTQSLNTHKKFDCGVMPQFSCEFCGKRFRRKIHMNRHIVHVHQKTDSRTSQAKHNCNKCSRSYSSLSSLWNHKCAQGATVKMQYICDFCGYKVARKSYLSRHITSKHLKL